MHSNTGNNKNLKKTAKVKNLRKKIKKRVDELSEKNASNRHAIALKYEKKKGSVPKIVASGKAKIATKILDLAEEHKIPLYEDEALSTLLEKLKIETAIPRSLYGLISEVLAFVYHLNKMLSKKGRHSMLKSPSKKNKKPLLKESSNV